MNRMDLDIAKNPMHAVQTLQVREVPLDDVVRQQAHERQVTAAARCGKLEAAKAHKRPRHPADHRARLHAHIAAARRICSCCQRLSFRV